MAEAGVEQKRFDDLANKSVAGRATGGLGFAMSGIQLALGRANLRWIALACVALNLVIYGVLVWLGWTWIDAVNAWLPDPAAHEGIVSWLLTAMNAGVKVLLFMGWLLVSIWMALAVGNILAGPLFDMLSERTEELLLGRTHAPPFSIGLAIKLAVKEVFVQLTLLLVYVPLVIAIFFVGLIPLVGALLGPALAWSLSALWVTLGLTGPALARHELGASARVSMVFGNKAMAAGFGAIGGIPFVSFLALPLLSPALVVGGTQMYLALAAWDRVPSKLTDADKALIRKDSQPLAR